MAHPSIQAVIFDLGGVLLDWSPRYVYRHYFEMPDQIDKFLTEIDFASWNTLQDKGRPFAEGVAVLSQQYPQYASLIRAYREHWDQSIAGPIAGTVKIARALKASGYAVYALSNCSAETFPIVRDRYDFFQLFDDILISGEVGLTKPDRRIYEMMLQRIRRPVEECLLIDDVPQNIGAAQQMGLKTILFQSADKLAAELQQMKILGPDWMVG